MGRRCVSAERIGLAVVGGLIVPQVLTLSPTLVVYLYFERFQKWMGRSEEFDGNRLWPHKRDREVRPFSLRLRST
jgi:hypothetical protein